MKFFNLLVSLFLFSISVSAIDIVGKVMKQDTKPIEFVSVCFLKNDSTIISNTQSDENGRFTINGNFKPDDYLLRLSYLGHNTCYVKISNLETSIDLGNFYLTDNTVKLNEISVTSNKVINKVDRQILLPSKMEIESSTNGFDMLNKMAVAGLMIDPINRTIKSRNEDVQIRINGIRATLQEVIALRPIDIARVEYFDEPGVRFGSENVGAVINYIVNRTKDSGAYIAIDGRNAPFVEFGDDQLSVKANHKASQFSLDYAISYRGYEKRWSEGKGNYYFPDNTVSFIETGIKMPMRYQTHDFNLTYNLTKADKYTFNVSFKDQIDNAKSVFANNILYTSNNQETYDYKKLKPKVNTPVLDLYYRQELKNKQSLVLNVVGTYIKTDQENWYNQTNDANDGLFIYNKVNGKKYSIIGELQYNKEFGNKMVFTAGAKHTQGYAENKYRGNTVSDNTMQNAESYIYAQLQGKIKDKLRYSVGLGGSRVWYKEGKFDQTYYLFRPSLQISYPINDNINLRYSFNVNTTTPSLGILTDVEQRIDSFMISRGNPDVKPYNTYTNRITASYTKDPFNIELNISYAYRNKPFMRAYSIEDNYILSYSDNYKSFQKFGADMSVSYTVFKDIWTLNGSIGSYRFLSNDVNQIFNYTNLYGSLQSNLLYKNFILLCGMYSRYNSLWGQSISYGEKWSLVEAGYKYKEAKLALGMSLPFDKNWSAGNKNLSNIKPYKSWTYIKENGRMVYLSFSWNIYFGRKYNEQDKKLNNTDNDAGIL